MYLQSIKSVKHNAAKSVNRSILKKSRHMGLGVFIVHSSIHSLIGWYFRPSLWTVALMDEGTILVYCCLSIFSLTSPLLPPSQTKCTVYTDSVVSEEGGGGVNCSVDHILQEFYTVSDQIQNLPNCFTTPNKMTSEDDIKGLVSLKFLCPW